MTLNTYAWSLPYLQVAPRQKLSRSDVIYTFTQQMELLSGRVWHGYDEFAAFEAALKVWLNPRGSGYLGGAYQHRHRAQMPYVTSFSSQSTIYPTTIPIRNDYYELEQLRDIV